jgi:hypothetical protein
MKRQVVAQNRQMLTAVSSMQLDVDTLHSLLAAHFQEVDQVLFVPVYASLSVSLPVPASKHASRLLPIFCSPLLSLRLLTSGLTKKWRQQRASCRKSAWQTPSAKFGDFHAALKRHQIALLSGTKLNFDLTTPPRHSQAALLGASGDGKGVERSGAHAGREAVILNFDSPPAAALSDL